MEAFTTHTGVVLPLDVKNVDTDQIVPKQYLLRVVKDGYGQTLFDDQRYLDYGEPDSDHSARRLNPDFILNQPRYAGCSVLLTRDNFGCGSSREHAVWALMQYGFRVIIAESFSDIFYDNAIKNGLLLIRLAPDVIEGLFQREAQSETPLRLAIDLDKQTIIDPTGQSIEFTTNPSVRDILLQGQDEIGRSLQLLEKIEAFEKSYYEQRPWLNPQ